MLCPQEINHEKIISLTTFLSFVIVDSIVYFGFCGPWDRIMKQMAVHHFICMTAFGGSIFRGGIMLDLSISAIITEISEPFFTGKCLFSLHGVKNGFLLKLNALLFSLTYLVFRLCWLSATFGLFNYCYV